VLGVALFVTRKLRRGVLIQSICLYASVTPAGTPCALVL